jgi:hypothetical protein
MQNWHGGALAVLGQQTDAESTSSLELAALLLFTAALGFYWMVVAWRSRGKQYGKRQAAFMRALRWNMVVAAPLFVCALLLGIVHLIRAILGLEPTG